MESESSSITELCATMQKRAKFRQFAVFSLQVCGHGVWQDRPGGASIDREMSLRCAVPGTSPDR
jgi:hypothetical protein